VEKIREAVGLALLSVGLIGFVLPVLPGIPFLLAAVAVLGPSHPKMRPWLSRIRQWIPCWGKSAPEKA
jgi:uncharacterized membrane protein YbaN (DUF454 family)